MVIGVGPDPDGFFGACSVDIAADPAPMSGVITAVEADRNVSVADESCTESSVGSVMMVFSQLY